MTYEMLHNTLKIEDFWPHILYTWDTVVTFISWHFWTGVIKVVSLKHSKLGCTVCSDTSWSVSFCTVWATIVFSCYWTRQARICSPRATLSLGHPWPWRRFICCPSLQHFCGYWLLPTKNTPQDMLFFEMLWPSRLAITIWPLSKSLRPFHLPIFSCIKCLKFKNWLITCCLTYIKGCTGHHTI